MESYSPHKPEVNYYGLLENAAYSVEFYLDQLRHPDTGRVSRKEYIDCLNQLLTSEKYNVKLMVEDERDRTFIAEVLGDQLKNMQLVGLNHDTVNRRGELVFQGEKQKYYKLPVMALPKSAIVMIEAGPNLQG